LREKESAGAAKIQFAAATATAARAASIYPNERATDMLSLVTARPFRVNPQLVKRYARQGPKACFNCSMKYAHTLSRAKEVLF